MSSIRDKTAIVTGGANGIGFQHCQQLLRNGVKTIALFDLPNSNGEAAERKLNKEFGGGRAIFFPVDVTKLEELEETFKNAVEALGGLDILINNAGIMNDAIWEKEIAVNFTGLVKSTLLAYEYMGKHKGGKGGIIVNLSSIVGLITAGLHPVYEGTKHAVLAFTISLKHQFEKTGVSLRVLCPGVTDTALVSEADNTVLDVVDNGPAMQLLRSYKPQPAKCVAEAMIVVIQKGTNGSVWMVKDAEPPFEITLEQYEYLK